ncbi:hypothetical protein RDI58_004550 [Solanum bulbocastanum]|uniref:Uncharacterized protein n=1 Tax=Solanum bulbocastanum TaxID=147425 RepID=A0AAN8U205_SOLBU
MQNVAAGTSVATVETNDATSNVSTGSSVAIARNASNSDFTNAVIESQSSVNAGPVQVALQVQVQV